MTEHWNKSYSQILGREMEYGMFGDAGKLCFAFPPQNGRFYDFPNFGMLDVVRPWIEAGRLRVVCPDGIDGETWSNSEGDGRVRIELQENGSTISWMSCCRRSAPGRTKKPSPVAAAWAVFMPVFSFSGGRICSTRCSA